MKCKLCEQFYKKYPLEWDATFKRKAHRLKSGISGPIKCAFEKGKFSSGNWSCQTMVRLRGLCGEGDGESNRKLCAYYMRYEDESIGVLPMFGVFGPEEEGVQDGYLVMTWYKGRGRTGRAYIWCDSSKPEVLTLKTAEAILEKYKEEE